MNPNHTVTIRKHTETKLIGTDQRSEQVSYVVPAIGLQRADGTWQLIPNPNGNQGAAYTSFDEALEATLSAGFDAEFEGRFYSSKTYDSNKPIHSAPAQRLTARAGQGWQQQWQLCLQSLSQSLQDKEPAVVEAAIEALGELRSPDIPPLLIPLLSAEDGKIRQALATALAKQGQGILATLLQQSELSYQQSGQKGFRVRLTLLQTAQELAKQLSLPQMSPLLPWLNQTLQDEHWLIRQQAAMVLGALAQKQWQQRLDQT